MLIVTACTAIGTIYFVDLDGNSDPTSGCFEIRPSTGKWSRNNLGPQQWASALKGRLLSSSASTFHRNYSRDEISVNATPTSKDSVSSPIVIDTSSDVYWDQLSTLSHGIALWNPNPPKNVYNNVSIGDVGYLQEGTFIRMFNAILPWDDPSNGTFGNPDPYEPVDYSSFANTLERKFGRVEHYSRSVFAMENTRNIQAIGPY